MNIPLFIWEMRMYKQWVKTKDVQWVRETKVVRLMGMQMQPIQKIPIHEFIRNAIIYNQRPK